MSNSILLGVIIASLLMALIAIKQPAAVIKGRALLGVLVGRPTHEKAQNMGQPTYVFGSPIACQIR